MRIYITLLHLIASSLLIHAYQSYNDGDDDHDIIDINQGSIDHFT